jgi:hypothetical protein
VDVALEPMPWLAGVLEGRVPDVTLARTVSQTPWLIRTA